MCWMGFGPADAAPSPSGGGTARTRRNHRLSSGTPPGSGGRKGVGLEPGTAELQLGSSERLCAGQLDQQVDALPGGERRVEGGVGDS